MSAGIKHYVITINGKKRDDLRSKREAERRVQNLQAEGHANVDLQAITTFI